MAFHAIGNIEQMDLSMGAHNHRRLVLMTIVTRIRGIVFRMTHLARHLLAAVIERERVSNQFRGLPPCRRVAILAHQTELPAMHRRFRVALDASRRRAAIHIIDMAFHAHEWSVFAVERKNHLVIKIFQAIRAIVASEARFASGFTMIRNEGRVVLRMARHTFIQHKILFGLFWIVSERMARHTAQRIFFVIGLVIDQRKPELVVRNFRKRRTGQTRRPSFMIGVTRHAISGICI